MSILKRVFFIGIIAGVIFFIGGVHLFIGAQETGDDGIVLEQNTGITSESSEIIKTENIFEMGNTGEINSIREKTILADSLSEVEKKPVISVFVRDGCTHCQHQKEFFDADVQIRERYKIRFIDINTPEGKILFDVFTSQMAIPNQTPITLVGGKIVLGFSDEQTTGQDIKKILESAGAHPSVESVIGSNAPQAVLSKGETCDSGAVCEIPDISSELSEVPSSDLTFHVDSSSVSDSVDSKIEIAQNRTFRIPFTGIVINPTDYAPGTMAMILGFIDGFNPCAMWVLMLLLITLLGLHDRRKMFFIAGVFIIAETILYYLIINFWYQTWNFVSMSEIINLYIKPFIALLAIGGGIFFLWEGFTSDGTCKVTNPKQQKKISQRIQELANSPLTIATFFGLVGMAFVVNIIEFACSIGIAQYFTFVLQINEFTFVEQQSYILIYVFFYMLDDFIVFGIALLSFQLLNSTHVYVRWTNLIGGLLMIELGNIMLLRPDLLIF